jgi:pimeloyl-ACP methyl ester carboxylesterase
MLSRRSFLAVAGSAVVAPTLLAQSAGQSGTPSTAAAGAKKNTLLFENPELDFQAIRTLGQTYFGAADIMETAATCWRITPGDANSWYDEWNQTASYLEELAAKSIEQGNTFSAGTALMRASMYFRQAEFYLHGNPKDPRILQAYNSSVRCFHQGLEFTQPDIQPIEFPYEGKVLRGYALEATGADRPRPLLILHTGFDGTAEEVCLNAMGAQQRGFHCLVFDGPGQGAAIRLEGLTFTPEWEKPVRSALSFARTHFGDLVDWDKVALNGISFGGFLCARAAAFIPEITALIPNGGIYSFFDTVLGFMGPEALEAVEKYPKEFDEGAIEYMKKDLTARWFFENGMWTFGAATPSELILAIKPYTLDGIIDQIRCPVLVIDAEDDQFMGNQPQVVYEKLSAPKELMKFSMEFGAGLHCQIGAYAISSEKIFDWLATKFS